MEDEAGLDGEQRAVVPWSFQSRLPLCEAVAEVFWIPEFAAADNVAVVNLERQQHGVATTVSRKEQGERAVRDNPNSHTRRRELC